MNEKIAVYKDGQQYGPFTVEEVYEHVLKGVFNPTTDFAWHEGMSDWLPLKDVILQAAPPPSQSSIPQADIIPVPMVTSTVDPTASKEEPAPARFWITFVLCLVLGILGAHRFWLGKKSAFIMLLTFGGCGLWWLIDIVLLLSNQLKDRKDRRVINPMPAVTWPVAAVWLLIVFANGHDKSIKESSKDVAQSATTTPSNQSSPAPDSSTPTSALSPFLKNIYQGTTDSYTVLDANGQPRRGFEGNPFPPIPKANVAVGFANGKMFLNQIEYPQSWSSHDAGVYVTEPTILENTNDYVKVDAKFNGVSQNAHDSTPEYVIIFKKDGKSATMHPMAGIGEPDTELSNLFEAGSGDSSSKSSNTSPNNEESIKADDVVGTWSVSKNYPRALTGSITLTVTFNEDGTYSRDLEGLSDHTIHDEGRWKVDGDSVSLTTLVGPASVPVGPDEKCYPKQNGLIMNFDGGQITLNKQ